MRNFTSFLFAACLMAFLVAALSSQGLAQDPDLGPETGYAPVTYRELVQTMMTLDRDLASHQRALDGYGEMLYCKYYKEFFQDDFVWDKFKNDIHTRIQEKREPYRTQFEMVTPVAIDRYDFEGEFYPLTEKTRLKNVILMVIHEFSQMRGTPYVPYCGRIVPNQNLPGEIRLTLQRPITMDKIKITPDRAQGILKAIEDYHGTGSRQVYARIRILLTDSDGVVRDSDDKITRAGFKGKIEAVDFFVDSKTSLFIGTGARMP